MAGIVSQILNMSLTGSIVILFVMAARLFLKKAPKIYSYVLWSVVLFRLLCPVSLPSPVSVLELFQPRVAESEGVSYFSYVPVEDLMVSTGAALPAVQAEPVSVQELQQTADTGPNAMEVLSGIWLAGIFAMVLYSGLVYIRLYRSLMGAIQWRGNVWLADRIPSAFVLGVFRPRIYLPSDLPMVERRYIMAHERHHIRRGDHIIKLLAYGALCIHWFNPLVWAGFLLAGKDMEMSCDEAVIKKLGDHIRADYCQTLLRLATHQRIISGTPLAFGEGDTKGRVKNMAKWRRPKVWLSVLCIAACIFILAVCALNPEKTSGGEAVTGNFHVNLPEGFRSETEENTLTFYKGRKLAGGVYQLQYPDFELEVDSTEIPNTWSWVEALNVPEKVPEERLVMSVEYVPYGKLSANYGNDGIVETIHHFRTGDSVVYDLWFDVRVVTEEEMEIILDNARTEKLALPGGYPFQLNTLPEGYFYGVDDEGNTVITDGSMIVGGIIPYTIPEGVYDPEARAFAWLEDVGIADFEDETLYYAGGMTSGNFGWGADFQSLPVGSEPTVDRHHVFYPVENVVYDIWFDMLLIDRNTMVELHRAVGFVHPYAEEVEKENQARKEARIFSSYPFQLNDPPEGYLFKSTESGAVKITDTNNVIVGAIVFFDIPEGALDEYDPYFDWLWDVGIPDLENDALAWSGSGSLYGDWEIHLESDVPPGIEKTVDRYHTFFVGETVVYDVWLDMFQINNTDRNAILSALTGWDGEEQTYMETEPSPLPENAVLYTDSFESDDGTVTININTAMVPEALEVEAGISLENCLTAMELEFRSTNVDDYGLDTTAYGHVGARCEVNVTQIRAGTYLISETQSIPTIEIWGTRKYIFTNGDELGEEMGELELLCISARDQKILRVFGRKD